MKVKPNQNPAIPVQETEVVNVKDGSSMSSEQSKQEKPFATDRFESFRFEMGGLPCSRPTETTKTSQEAIKPGEHLGVKYTMFMPD